MHDTQRCAVMFEGYDTEEIVHFEDIEPYEVGLRVPVIEHLFIFVGRILRGGRRLRTRAIPTISTCIISTK